MYILNIVYASARLQATAVPKVAAATSNTECIMNV
jgi:hypothetical protein